MLDLCRLILGMVFDLLRSRVALEAESLVLRQQINLLRRTRPKVYAVMDASGDPSEMASPRFIQAGVIPTSANAVLSETHRTWNCPEAGELAKLYALATPNYAAVIESNQKAQEVAKQTK